MVRLIAHIQFLFHLFLLFMIGFEEMNTLKIDFLGKSVEIEQETKALISIFSKLRKHFAG